VPGTVTVQHLGVSDDLSRRRAAVEQKGVTKSLFSIDGAHSAKHSRPYKEAHELFFPIPNGYDAFAFAIPLEVISDFQVDETSRSFMSRKKERERERRGSHILPEITLYSPLSAWSSPTRSQTRTGTHEFYEVMGEGIKGGGGFAYQCPRRRQKRNSILWERRVRRSCSERGRCTLSPARGSFSAASICSLTIRRRFEGGAWKEKH